MCLGFGGVGWLDSRCRRVMSSLGLTGCSHARRRVVTLAVVEDLYVLKDCVGQLDFGLTAMSV